MKLDFITLVILLTMAITFYKNLTNPGDIPIEVVTAFIFLAIVVLAYYNSKY